MSINLENQGIPIAVIVSKNGDGKKKGSSKKSIPIVSINDTTEGIIRPTNELSLRDKPDLIFQPIPNPSVERQISYITGCSGSGKSYYTRKYCAEFAKLFPKRNIYLFSSISSDDSIDSLKGLNRIKLSPEFIEENWEIEDFRDCLVIFDDTDCITDKKTRNKVNSILNMILETGRHTNTYCIYTSHLACAGNDTKRILNEANSITFFPETAGGRTLKYLLESYMGLDKNQIKKIKALPSRWITVCKSYPRAIITEKDILLTNSL
jgi:hypothetical protein